MTETPVDTPADRPADADREASGPGAARFSVAYGWWLLVCCLSLVGLGRLAWQRSRWQNVRPVAPRYQVDLNTASQAELEVLPEVGAALARRIVDHRLVHGPFDDCEGLLEVRGVGHRTLERLRPMLTVLRPLSENSLKTSTENSLEPVPLKIQPGPARK